MLPILYCGRFCSASYSSSHHQTDSFDATAPTTTAFVNDHTSANTCDISIMRLQQQQQHHSTSASAAAATVAAYHNYDGSNYDNNQTNASWLANWLEQHASISSGCVGGGFNSNYGQQYRTSDIRHNKKSNQNQHSTSSSGSNHGRGQQQFLYEEIELKCHKIFYSNPSQSFLLQLGGDQVHQQQQHNDELMADYLSDLTKAANELLSPAIEALDLLNEARPAPVSSSSSSNTNNTSCATNEDNQRISIVEITNETNNDGLPNDEQLEIDDKLYAYETKQQRPRCSSFASSSSYKKYAESQAIAVCESNVVSSNWATAAAASRINQFCRVKERREEKEEDEEDSEQQRNEQTEFNVIDEQHAELNWQIEVEKENLCRCLTTNDNNNNNQDDNMKERKQKKSKLRRRRLDRGAKHKSGSLKTHFLLDNNDETHGDHHRGKSQQQQGSFSLGWLNLSRQFHEMFKTSVKKYDLAKWGCSSAQQHTQQSQVAQDSRVRIHGSNYHHYYQQQHRYENCTSSSSSSGGCCCRSGGRHFMVMISYSHADGREYALQLKEELEKLGLSVYLDLHEIRFGSDWQDSLNEAILNCECLVALVTPSYGETLWTRRELKLADVLAKLIIPVNFLPPSQWPPKSLAIQFATMQYVSWLGSEVPTNVASSKKPQTTTNPNPNCPSSTPAPELALMTSSFGQEGEGEESSGKKRTLPLPLQPTLTTNNKWWHSECVRAVSRQIKEALILSASSTSTTNMPTLRLPLLRINQQQLQYSFSHHKYCCSASSNSEVVPLTCTCICSAASLGQRDALQQLCEPNNSSSSSNNNNSQQQGPEVGRVTLMTPAEEQVEVGGALSMVKNRLELDTSAGRAANNETGDDQSPSLLSTVSQADSMLTTSPSEIDSSTGFSSFCSQEPTKRARTKKHCFSLHAHQADQCEHQNGINSGWLILKQHNLENNDPHSTHRCCCCPALNQETKPTLLKFPINLAKDIRVGEEKEEKVKEMKKVEASSPPLRREANVALNEQHSQCYSCALNSSPSSPSTSNSCPLSSSTSSLLSSDYICLPKEGEKVEEDFETSLQWHLSHSVSSIRSDEGCENEHVDDVVLNEPSIASRTTAGKMRDKVTTTTTNLLQKRLRRHHRRQQQQQQNYLQISKEEPIQPSQPRQPIAKLDTKKDDEQRNNDNNLDIDRRRQQQQQSTTRGGTSTIATNRRMKSSFRERAMKAMSKIKRSLLPSTATADGGNVQQKLSVSWKER